MEAHGTGTALGDPIEVSAVSAIMANSKEEPLIFGLKGNIGHTESTAGVAGLLKLAGTLRGCEGT
jgi:acyl transferase domain-containing protein